MSDFERFFNSHYKDGRIQIQDAIKSWRMGDDFMRRLAAKPLIFQKMFDLKRSKDVLGGFSWTYLDVFPMNSIHSFSVAADADVYINNLYAPLCELECKAGVEYVVDIPIALMDNAIVEIYAIPKCRMTVNLERFNPNVIEAFQNAKVRLNLDFNSVVYQF